MGCGSAVEDVVADVGLTAIGQPELIPLANAGVAVANGGGIKGALTAGGEALAGQELGGAVGIGEGNSSFNDALGITGDNPAGTGLPDIGSGINNAIGSVGNELGFSGGTAAPVAGTDAAGQPVGSSGSVLSAAPPPSTSLPGAGAGGTVSAGGLDAFDQKALNNEVTNSFYSGGGATPPSSLPNLASISGDTAGAAGNSSIGAAGTDAIGSAKDSLGVAGGVLGQSSVGAAPAAPPSSFLSNLESGAGKAAIPAAALAFEGAKGPQKLPSQASALESGGAATAPLLGLEQQGATEASTGQLTPSQQASVEQFVQQQQNQLLQQLASQGITNPTKSSQYQAGLAAIQQQALAMQQNYITQAISEATSAGGAASGNIASVANEQVQLDTDYQNALAEAFGALGGSIGGGGINIRPQA